MKTANKESLAYNEIVEIEKKSKAKSPKIYKAESMEISDDRISITTSKVLNELTEIDKKEKISLLQTDLVKEKTKVYFQACVEASTFPNMQGLARSLGCSRRAIYKFMNSNPSHSTSKWIELCQDAFSEILNENALRGNVNPVYAIFNQKAQYGWQDKTAIEISNTDNPMADFPSAEEVESKYKNTNYLDLLVDEEVGN